MNGDIARHLRRLTVLALVACAVTACGRKGALEPPPKANVAKTQGGPAAQADAENEAAAQDNQPALLPAGSGINSLRARKSPPVRPPKQPFFMDPILE